MSHGRKLLLYIAGWTALLFVPCLAVAALLDALGFSDEASDRIGYALGRVCGFLWIAGIVAILLTVKPAPKRRPRPTGWDGEDDEDGER